MKFYLNIAKVNRENKIDASIIAFATLQDAIEEFSKHRKLYGSSETKSVFGNNLSVCFISTSGENVAYKVKKNLFGREYLDFKFKVSTKFTCGRRYIETDPEYGLVDAEFDIFYTNYITATREFEKIMKGYYELEKRDTYFVREDEKI